MTRVYAYPVASDVRVTLAATGVELHDLRFADDVAGVYEQARRDGGGNLVVVDGEIVFDRIEAEIRIENL